MKPKIVFLDVETAPLTAHVWSLFQDSINAEMLISEWYVLCWTIKELHNKKTITKALPDFKLYKKDPEDDKELMIELWEQLQDVSILIAHNGIRFDLKKINTRFVYHGLGPLPPFKVIDTLKEAKNHFGFTSNRLNELGKFLHLGEKVNTGGFKLWQGCLRGDTKSWEHMKYYNKVDVLLLEKIYLKLQPFITKHPNMSLYHDGTKLICPKCGSDKVIFRGNYYTVVSKFKRIYCNDCRGWSHSRINTFDLEKRKVILSNAI